MPRLHHDIALGTTLERVDVAGLSLQEVRYAEGTTIPPHAHRNPGVTVVLSGGFSEHVDGRDVEVTPAHVAIKPAGTVHANEFAAEGTRSFIVEVHPEFARNHAVDVHGRCHWMPHGVAAAKALSLYDAFRRRRHDHEELERRATDFAAEMYARRARAARDHVLPADDGRLTAARRLLAIVPETPRVADVAREVGLHPVHLARLFRRHLGCSPSEYRQRQRVGAALQRIASVTPPALADIALKSGFCDQSHLCRAVGRQLGMTPSAFRDIVAPH